MKIYFLKFVFVLAFSLLPFIASANQTEHNMSGWAWSSNIGWVSFNCTNTGTCEDEDTGYGVNKDPGGTLTGYAWSSNIGWIKFGGLTGFPSWAGTEGTDPKNAELKSNSKLEGWAKALSADGNGWDGWISLSGTNYGVTFDSGTKKFTGYAWGSEVVGWLSFDAAGPSGVCVCDPKLENPEVVNPVHDTVAANSANLGATVTKLGNPTAFARGIIYSSTSSDPDLSNSLYINTLDAPTLGSYSINVPGLTDGTTYHYRGYAKNITGGNLKCLPQGTVACSTVRTFTTETNGGWTGWSVCDENNMQTRTCTNPSPSEGGLACTNPLNPNYDGEGSSRACVEVEPGRIPKVIED